MWKKINSFDKICWVCAFPAGVALIILGATGVLMGSHIYLKFKPLKPAGFVPILMGWGIIRAIYFAWAAGSLFDRKGKDKELKPAVEGRKRDMKPLNGEATEAEVIWNDKEGKEGDE